MLSFSTPNRRLRANADTLFSGIRALRAVVVLGVAIRRLAALDGAPLPRLGICVPADVGVVPVDLPGRGAVSLDIERQGALAPGHVSGGLDRERHGRAGRNFVDVR